MEQLAGEAVAAEAKVVGGERARRSTILIVVEILLGMGNRETGRYCG